MTKEEFLSQIERAATVLPGLPVTAGLLRQMGEELKKGDPAWWKNTLKAWERRRFAGWTEAWSLFLTCVHYEVLSDPDGPLAPYFPSCGGTDEAEPSRVFSQFLSDLPKEFFFHLRNGQRRVFLELWAPLWVSPAALFFQQRGLPFYLVEVNAGAGLNLAADMLVPQKGFDSQLLAARIGIDPAPLELENIEHKRWLTAALMPDQLPLIRALDKAIKAVLERQSREAAFIQMVPCEAQLAPKFIAKNIPVDDKDVGLLLFNIGATSRMGDSEYAAYKNSVAEMMKPWGERALWVELESVREEIYSTTFQLRINRISNGQLSQYIMAQFDFAAKKTSYDPRQSAKFLSIK
ncbi:MAG: hypothetical protein A3J74_01215 [Elusimicrobia bacterium RIFCSPHIGHO2_02_FULL_57_9]|nr:MAG: hypothetical protein A3J74_01215 [Elusimicrobia bacterium RIFCSPHIGHO2_02_FULL_57_9]